MAAGLNEVRHHGERLLSRTLDAAHFAAPDELPVVVAREAATIGVGQLVLYLVDYEQVRLIPLQGDGIAVREPLEIDTTLAGRAFRTVQALEGQADGGRRLWLPLLDGTERVGVMEATLPAEDAGMREQCASLASLAAELLVTKGAFTDVFARARRNRNVSLPAEIQWSLLPPLTLVTPRVTISAVLEPAYDVGGDGFDYAVDGSTVHVAVFDAMGHGLESSLLSVVAISSYRNSRRHGLRLAEAFLAMDRTIAAQFGNERFVTAWLGELDLDSGYLRWISAGHPSPLLIRGTKIVGNLAARPLLPMGMGDPDVVITEQQLEPGDRVLLYTDGVIEARAPNGEFFGVHRLADFVVREAASGQRAPETLRRLAHAILAHQQGQLTDDATILFVEWPGA